MTLECVAVMFRHDHRHGGSGLGDDQGDSRLVVYAHKGGFLHERAEQGIVFEREVRESFPHRIQILGIGGLLRFLRGARLAARLIYSETCASEMRRERPTNEHPSNFRSIRRFTLPGVTASFCAICSGV